MDDIAMTLRMDSWMESFVESSIRIINLISSLCSPLAGATTERSVRWWPDPKCSLTPALEPISTWRCSTSVSLTVRIPFQHFPTANAKGYWLTATHANTPFPFQVPIMVSGFDV